MPTWCQEGGYAQWAKRLKNPELRKKIIREMKEDTDEWENFFFGAGPERMLTVGFKNPELRKYTGKTIAEIAEMRGQDPAETVCDLVIEDGSRVSTVYFLMTEENIIKKIKLPWMSFCSDASSLAPEGDFLNNNVHPRAYGSFARLLGKYVRDENIIELEEAIRRLTSHPAEVLSLKKRGFLKPGFFADLVIFDPESVEDKATFDMPHQYSLGVHHVFVNGVQVLKKGEHTGNLPGRFIKGPGYQQANN
jgi:N-acyl-D-amino-acid deacylase